MSRVISAANGNEEIKKCFIIVLQVTNVVDDQMMNGNGQTHTKSMKMTMCVRVLLLSTFYHATTNPFVIVEYFSFCLFFAKNNKYLHHKLNEFE